MKLISIFSIFILLFVLTTEAQRPEPDRIPTDTGDLVIQPVRHGSLVLSWNNIDIYVDPNGEKDRFEGIGEPELVLITDIHGDHLNVETLESLETGKAVMVVPKAVAERLPDGYKDQVVIIGNGEQTEQLGISIKAVPMYNLPETRDSRHPKGRGNGYVLQLGGKHVYISGDTEDIPEMRALENIDIAFVCMNLPYTMDVNQAADAVLDFRPGVVYPYHYRGQDTEKFKELVTTENDDIEVRLKDWYQ